MASTITLTFYRGNNNLSLLQPPFILPPPSILIVEEEEKGKREPEKGMKVEEEAKIASKVMNKKNTENEENTNKNNILKESVKSLKKSFFSFLSLDENFELDQDLPQPQKKIHTEPSSLPPSSSTHFPAPPPDFNIPPSLIPIPPSLPPPPFMGLPNLGNTCFINSVVQAICNLSQVKEYFRTEEPEFCSLAKNMQEFLNQGRKDSLLKKLNSCFPNFFDGKQHDAHEFFVVFLEKLNEELKKDQKDNHEPTLELDEELKFWLNHSKTE